MEHLTHLWRYLRARPPEHQAFYHIAEAFEHFTNQPPQSLLQFPRQHKNLFAEAAAPTRGGDLIQFSGGGLLRSVDA